MNKLSSIIICLTLLLSCQKDPPLEPDTTEQFDNGLIILNEGLFQQNNASLSFYSLSEETTYHQVFNSENGRGLGDTANDFEKFSIGGIEYIIIAVDVSSQIEIIEANTMKSVSQIPIFNGANGREPRRVKVYQENAFVCNYDGTVSVIDLGSNSIVKTLTVGTNPDGMSIVGNRLYVSNSGGLSYPNYDSTITIIDMDLQEVIGSINTRINSTQMITDSEGDIYLLSTGNYADIDPALLRIDTQLDSVVEIFNLPLSTMTFYNDWIYYYDQNSSSIKGLNTIDEIIDPTVIIDCSGFETLYKIQMNPANGDIYCIDAKGYVNSSIISCYDLAGNFKYEFTAGLNASKIIFN